MIDPCVPVWCWLIAGEDALWLWRHSWADLAPDEVGFDAQDLDVCMLRCEVALYIHQNEEPDEEGIVRQTICGFPVQCAQLAAFDAAGRLLCQDHHAS